MTDLNQDQINIDLSRLSPRHAERVMSVLREVTMILRNDIDPTMLTEGSLARKEVDAWDAAAKDLYEQVKQADKIRRCIEH